MPNREGYESRKKSIYGTWLNPKCHIKNGQSATKPRIEESSTTISQESRSKRSEVVGIRKDEDMVFSLSKDKGHICVSAG